MAAHQWLVHECGRRNERSGETADCTVLNRLNRGGVRNAISGAGTIPVF